MWKEESQTEIMWKKKTEAYNTCGSQSVTHPSTEQSRHCLTSVIRRELVYSVWYGGMHKLPHHSELLCIEYV